MKNKLILISLILFLATIRCAFAGPPSIEMSIYPRSALGDIQSILDFAKEKKGLITITKLVYKDNVLKCISGSIKFEDGLKKEFKANGNFKRLYIKRTFGDDNKLYVKVMRKSEDE